MRLDKFLTDTGFGSRKDVKRLIRENRVSINNNSISDPSVHINENNDIVTLNKVPVKYKKHRHYIFYKPSGVVSALKDKNEKTILDIIPEEINRKDLVISGRLDKDTEGLLFLTTNGDLSHKILSPKYHVKKRYHITLEEHWTEPFIQKLKNGPVINDNNKEYKTSLMDLNIHAIDEISFIITEGKFHQVKKMIISSGNRVKYLVRTEFAGMNLTGLKKGEIREITLEEEAELSSLVH